MRLEKNADIRRLCGPNSDALQLCLLALQLKAWHAPFSSIQVAFPAKHLFKACYSSCKLINSQLHVLTSLHTINIGAFKQLLCLRSQRCPGKDAYKTTHSRHSLPVGAQAGLSMCAMYGLVITGNSNASFECPALAAGTRATFLNWA